MRQAVECAADDRVAGVLALGDGRERQAFGYRGRHILEAVNREIDRAIEQRVLNFFCEQPFRSDLGQWHVQD